MGEEIVLRNMAKLRIDKWKPLYKNSFRSPGFVHLRFDEVGMAVCVCIGKHWTWLVIGTCWLGNVILYPAYEEELEFVNITEQKH